MPASTMPIESYADVVMSFLKERIETFIIRATDVRIERIISHGHASAADFWYDQPSTNG